jgi:hypothetical protein
VSQEPDTPPPVRQRNTTPYTFNFAETANSPAHAVLPGETTEHPVLLDGWTAVDEEAEPSPTADETPAKTPSRKRAAAADLDKDGGEPR